MSLVILNGSPRGTKSNSSVIAGWFLEGYREEGVPILNLNKIKHHEEYAELVHQYDRVMFVFPLYVDGMPGIVKNFFEVLAPFKEQMRGKKVTYIIHSGFSKAIQCNSLERYLNRYSTIMGFTNHGIVVIPGSEGFRLMPPKMLHKKKNAMATLASNYKSDTPYEIKSLKTLRGKEKMSKQIAFALRILSKIGITNMYWNMELKKNNAFKKRYDAPYAKSPVPITSK